MAKLRVTMGEIKRVTAEVFGVSLADLEGRSRQDVASEARKVAIYLCVNDAQRTLSEVGRAFDGRDHSSVHTAVNWTKRALLTDFDVEIEAKVIMARRGLQILSSYALEDRI